MGYDVHRLTGNLGEDAFRDIQTLSGGKRGLVCMDVGANVGQTIDRLRATLDQPLIHAFEPGPTAFAELARKHGKTAHARLNNCGVGSRPGTLELIENVHTHMSSMLEQGAEPWGEVKGRVPVEVVTLDAYCAEQGIERIDVLKSDTQGFDLEVIRGAEAMFAEGRVHLVLLEVNFNQAYENVPRLDEIYGFVHDHGLRPVSFYNFHYMARQLSWFEALFVAPEYAA